MKLFLVVVELRDTVIRTSYRIRSMGPESAAFMAVKMARQAGVLVDAIHVSELV